jgi:hypothetical protein
MFHEVDLEISGKGAQETDYINILRYIHMTVYGKQTGS